MSNRNVRILTEVGILEQDILIRHIFNNFSNVFEKEHIFLILNINLYFPKRQYEKGNIPSSSTWDDIDIDYLSRNKKKLWTPFHNVKETWYKINTFYFDLRRSLIFSIKRI